MDLVSLKSFAKEARSLLLKIVDFKIDYVLNDISPARRENPKAVIELENRLKIISKSKIVEEVSYTWFNRFIALYYMDINGFNPVKVILNSDGKTRPEILSNALGGVFDDDRDTYITAENTPGADDDKIRFYAGGSEVASVTANRFDIKKLEVDDISVSGSTLQTITTNQNLTLQAIQNHKFSNILDNIGEKDISSHVNFEDLKNIALKHKLKIEEYCTQRDFLIKYGIIERYKVIFNSSKLNSLRTDLERLIGKDNDM